MTTIASKSLLPSFLLCQALGGFAAFADDAQKSVGTYEKSLTDKDPLIRQSSIKGLEALEATDAADRVAPLLLKDPDPGVREEAAQALKGWRNPASLFALTKGAADPIVNVRVVCIEALGESPDPAAHKAVLAAAKDAAPEVRRTVMDQFAYASTPDVVPAVTAALSDPDPAVRANAAQAIRFYAKLHMPAELKVLLNDPDPTVEASAARSLIQAGDNAGVKPALDLIKNDNQAARLLAIDALGYTQAPEAKAALAQVAATDSDPYAREGAQQSLKRMRQTHS
jgi:HEAT repeat protein